MPDNQQTTNSHCPTCGKVRCRQSPCECENENTQLRDLGWANRYAAGKREGSMATEDWLNLEHLGELSAAKCISAIGRDNMAMLLNDTTTESEHPEGYEGPCLCRECCSYGD